MTSQQQSQHGDIARRVGAVVAAAVLDELKRGDQHGRQITIHLPPGSAPAAIRIVLPPATVTVTPEGAKAS